MNQMGMNQIGMNMMGMNQINMNQVGMNQMGMNPMNMNMMGMNPMNMNQMGLNQMNINQINSIGINNTTLNIKSIVQPYENKIKELEEIIRQKDFEITVLKQKVINKNSNNNFMNINMNQNQMMIIPQTNPMMMMNDNYYLPEENEEIKIIIKSQDEEFKIKCSKKDKISSLYDKYYIKGEGEFTYNYKLLDRDMTLNNAGLNNFSVIHVKKIRNVIFQTTTGLFKNFCLSDDCPIGLALLYHLMEYPLSLWSIITNKLNVSFIFNTKKLSLNDVTNIETALEHLPNPKIVVNYF